MYTHREGGGHGACNPRSQKAETGGSQVAGQPDLCRETLSGVGRRCKMAYQCYVLQNRRNCYIGEMFSLYIKQLQRK